jgi:hypothetical protein
VLKGLMPKNLQKTPPDERSVSIITELSEEEISQMAKDENIEPFIEEMNKEIDTLKKQRQQFREKFERMRES